MSLARCTKDGLVLLGQRGAVDDHVGEVDALAAAQRAAHLDHGFETVRIDLRHPKNELPVVNQKTRSRRQRREDLRMRKSDAGAVAGFGRLVEGEAVSGREFNTLSHLSDPVLRALEVGQNTCRAAGDILEAANGPDPLGLLLLRAVREIQAEDVYPGLYELKQPLGRPARRADGCNDLRGTLIG